jgi:hypothetical protein
MNAEQARKIDQQSAYNSDAAQLDRLVAYYTGFKTLEQMLNAAGGYRPTIRCTREVNARASEKELADLLAIADAYDAAQAERGDPRRAFRG